MRHSLLFLFVAAVPLVAQPPVPKDHPEKMIRGTDTFKKHVRPVFITHCLKCHGGEKTEGELDIVERERLLKGGDHGPAVVPGDPAKSLLYLMVTHAKKPVMPFKAEKLPAETLKHIEAWIADGAPYDAPLVANKEATAWQSKQVPAEAKQHWAYRPLLKAEPPALNDAWIRTPLDRFILAKLNTKGLKPNPATSPRQLLRRAYFDLVGLPPTAEEVAAFEKDPSPDAFAKIVDQLLDSPRYGERWARHWLDLARFAESHGFEHDYDRPSAYHYRDFVIRAFNSGMPYDTFVKWQLAGDELAPHDPQAMMATGFLAAGVHSTQITKNEVEKHRYDELDDMLSTTTTAMLGLTVGCARCHDHKYDAIPQGDYYRMLATFTATVRTETEFDLNAKAYQTALAKHQAEHAPLLAARAKYEKDELPARWTVYEKANQGKPVLPTWVIADLTSMRSTGEATITKQDDGSVLLSGKNPPKEMLTFTFDSSLKGINALRIEALADASLMKKGPGRAANGNFCLTNLVVEAGPKNGKMVAIKLKNPRSTFDQKGLGIATAIDADTQTSGWAIDPQFGSNHAASFEFEKPLTHDGDSTFKVTMMFNNNTQHGMGRPRLAISNAPEPLALESNGMSAAAQQALATPPEKRTAAQQEVLLSRYKVLDAGWQALDAKVREHAATTPKKQLVKALISSEGVKAVRLHTQGEDVLKDTHYLRRGDPNNKEGVAAAGYLQVLANGAGNPWAKTPPKGSPLTYRRAAFAEWLTDHERGAGMLLARVIVNRLWAKHFGRGLVGTVSDFGIRGEKPSHPELLDYLATELIRNGWRLKPIHKLIVTSAVYQQSSASDEMKTKLDRDNTLLARYNTHRLEAEAIRDSLLAISGQLDTTMYGPGTFDEASKRRSVYFTMKRSRLIPMLVIFDAPDGTVGIGERPVTTVAPQALLMMNNPHVRQWAKGFAQRIGQGSTEATAVVERAYRTALGRSPTPNERAEGVQFLQRQEQSYQGKAEAATLARVDYCHVLLCLNELMFVD